MRKLASLAALLMLSAATSLPALADGARDRRLAIYGLTGDQRLILFRDNRPQRSQTLGAIAGLSGDRRLVGIDFRPASGALVGLGDAGGVYEIDPLTANATWKSQLNVSGAPLALSGASFGVYSRLEAGTSVAVRAFAALGTRLYAVDLLSGAATPIGDFREGDVVIGLAVPPNQE